VPEGKRERGVLKRAHPKDVGKKAGGSEARFSKPQFFMHRSMRGVTSSGSLIRQQCSQKIFPSGGVAQLLSLNSLKISTHVHPPSSKDANDSLGYKGSLAPSASSRLDRNG